MGISTTVMDTAHPRYSTSEALLKHALVHAQDALQVETQCIALRDLQFRPCEGFYSKSARACTWPCSITQMDPSDQLDRVYEAFVHWADVILVATPIRWGAASSLYYKMVERMNCIQNQETIANRHLLKNKVAAFLITGGQDNVQGVAGQLLGFFAEVGCQFPQFPFIAHSRGWSAEDMENNVRYVQRSKALREGALRPWSAGRSIWPGCWLPGTFPNDGFHVGAGKRMSWTSRRRRECLKHQCRVRPWTGTDSSSKSASVFATRKSMNGSYRRLRGFYRPISWKIPVFG